MLKVIESFDFIKNTYEDLQDCLYVRNRKYDSESNLSFINYEQFCLTNPITTTKYPEFDKPFFDRMNATLKHKLHCFTEGWITSERQVFYTSDECMTTIQFIMHDNEIVINVFMRSSNIRNIDQDIQFLNYFLEDNFNYQNKELNVFVSMPHIFLDRITKVDK